MHDSCINILIGAPSVDPHYFMTVVSGLQGQATKALDSADAYYRLYPVHYPQFPLLSLHWTC